MAITATTVGSNNTLEQFRVKFNNLVTDVTAIEGGTISFTALNTTTTNTTTLNVKEDGTIIFEDATDDAFETTLTVVDPTADRTVTIPNETGTVHTSGGTTTHTGILVADGGNIGSASDSDALAISSGGVVTFSQRDVHSAGITIADGGQIGSASDTDAIAIAANGMVVPIV